jgi:uncharacterized protein (DUF302 family)
MKIRYLLAAVLSLLLFTGCEKKEGTAFIETIKSHYTTAEGVKRLEAILEEKGLSLFQVIDHAQNAKNSDMRLLPNTVVVFGNPKMGTVLMQCNQSMGLDLPLRMQFYTDYEGTHWIGFTNPEYYTLKHNIKDKKCLAIITKAHLALQSLAEETAGSETANSENNSTAPQEKGEAGNKEEEE